MGLRDKMTGKSKNDILEVFEKWNFSNQLLDEIKSDDNFYNNLMNMQSEVHNGDRPETIYRATFKKVAKLPDLINSEGGIFKIVEGHTIVLMTNRITESKDFFLKGMTENGLVSIYSKFNISALELYFHGRITLKELLLLRIDEPFCLEIRQTNPQKAFDYVKEWVFFDDYFERELLNTLKCGDDYYFQLPRSMRVENPFAEVIDILKNMVE